MNDLIIQELEKALNNENYNFSYLKEQFDVNKQFTNIKNPNPPQQSAVLIPLFPDQGKIKTVFLQRVNDGSVHGGQISFPGGHYEKSDKNLAYTALRETYEELGINPKDVKILGQLSKLYIPVSNFEVYPFVGWLERKPIFKTNPDEVETIHILPIDFILSGKYIKTKRLDVRGIQLKTIGYSIDGIFIWGATAKILAELSGYLELLHSFTI